MVEQVRVPKVTKDEVLNQVRAATFDAVLEVLRSGSDDPSAAGGLTNLLAAIRDGTEAATKALLRSGELRPSTPKHDAPVAEEEALK